MVQVLRSMLRLCNNRPLASRVLLPIVVLMPLGLAGCGGTEDLARSIGLTRDVPDEFTVTTRAPLSMPPDFTLRPPTPGARRPQEQSARASAEAALAPQSTLAPAAGMSPGQTALLSAAGPAAPASIRNEVNKEASMEAGNRSLTDRMMFWKTPPLPGTVVDPQREARRLRENAALGQSAEAGDTAIIQRKSPGLLDRLF